MDLPEGCRHIGHWLSWAHWSVSIPGWFPVGRRKRQRLERIGRRSSWHFSLITLSLSRSHSESDSLFTFDNIQNYFVFLPGAFWFLYGSLETKSIRTRGQTDGHWPTGLGWLSAFITHRKGEGERERESRLAGHRARHFHHILVHRWEITRHATPPPPTNNFFVSEPPKCVEFLDASVTVSNPQFANVSSRLNCLKLDWICKIPLYSCVSIKLTSKKLWDETQSQFERNAVCKIF